MGEKEAEILDDCLSAIVEVGPLIALLENVYGLMTVGLRSGLWKLDRSLAFKKSG